MPKRILITGGAGYLGTCVVKSALAAGFHPVVLDQAEIAGSALAEFAEQIEYHQGSILEADTLSECLQHVEAVIHLAGVSDGRAGKQNPELTRTVNLESMQGLIQSSKAAGVSRFLFASTMGVYGNGYQVPLTEDLELRPVDPYSASKAEAETLVSSAHSEHFATASLRIALLYGLGPRLRNDLLVNTLCKLAQETGHLKIQGGEQRRPTLHIEDLAALFIDLLTAPVELLNGEAFNVVESNPSISEVATLIRRFQQDLLIERLPARDAEDSFEMDGSKVRDRFGFRPRRTLPDGIRELLEYYKQPTTSKI